MSLKGDKYESSEEVKFRLESTVVLYDQKPVYITRVQMPEDMAENKEVARVYFCELPYAGKNGAEVRKYLSSKKFDLAPFKMGYMNYKGQALFTTRQPIRQNKQGLSQSTLFITDIKGKNYREMGLADFIRTDNFCNMINGVFPDFKQIGELIGDNETSSAAVSRSFAFFLDHELEAVYLVHKGIKCGIAMKGDKALKVPPKFHFLRQEMEEHRIPLV